MSSEQWGPVWQRIRAGQHSIVFGADQIPSAPTDLHLLQINCARPWSTTGPLDKALQQIQALLETNTQAIPNTRKLRVASVAETVATAFISQFVTTSNQLVKLEGGHTALCLLTVDHADPATLATLATILQKPGWLQLPLVLLAGDAQAQTLVELLAAIHIGVGEEAIISLPNESSSATTVKHIKWSRLSPAALRVLRAGAVIGGEFEAGLIARLLDEPVATVLEQLQQAKDAQIPLHDLGNERFTLNAATEAELRDQLLPSLVAFWHQRLGKLLSAEEMGQPTTATTPSSISKPPLSVAATEPSRFADLFEHSQSTVNEETVSNRESVTPSSSEQMQAEPPLYAPSDETQQANYFNRDQLRAADYFQAAGESKAALQQYLSAGYELLARGDSQRAYLVAQQGLQTLDEMPNSEPNKALRTELLLQLAQAQWQGYGFGAPFTLAQALKTLREAATILPATATPELHGKLATMTAGVCYDLGDQEALRQALHVLSESSRRLLAQGAREEAAYLLNDQAAIYVQLGESRSATQLLDTAQTYFEQLTANDTSTSPIAMAELARTHHLFARLPLHAQIRTGHEQTAYQVGLEHAGAAEQGYRRLDWQRELARVAETAAKLELRLGYDDAAHTRLINTLKNQQQLGDSLGLARSCAALADWCIKEQQYDQALDLLTDSINLNYTKGSPLGLVFNRHSIQTLLAAIKQHTPENPALTERVAQIAQQLSQAEAAFGRLTLPEIR